MRKYVVCFLAIILILNTSVIAFAEEKDSDCQVTQEDMTIEYDDDFLSIQPLILEPMSWTVKNKLEKRTRSFHMKKGKKKQWLIVLVLTVAVIAITCVGGWKHAPK